MLKLTVLISDDSIVSMEEVNGTLVGHYDSLPWSYQHPGDLVVSALRQFFEDTMGLSNCDEGIRREPGTDLIEVNVGRNIEKKLPKATIEDALLVLAEALDVRAPVNSLQDMDRFQSDLTDALERHNARLDLGRVFS